MPDVSAATITYATKQLRLTAKNHAQLLPQVQAICSTIEAGVKVVERIGKPVLAENINQRKKSGGILSMSDEQRSLAEIVFGGILFIISEIHRTRAGSLSYLLSCCRIYSLGRKDCFNRFKK